MWCMHSMMSVMFPIQRTQQRDDVTSLGARLLTYIRDIPPHLTLVHGILQISLTILPGTYSRACQKDWHVQTLDTWKGLLQENQRELSGEMFLTVVSLMFSTCVFFFFYVVHGCMVTAVALMQCLRLSSCMFVCVCEDNFYIWTVDGW